MTRIPSEDLAALEERLRKLHAELVASDGSEGHRVITVPWTTIKNIMAAIRARALSKEPK